MVEAGTVCPSATPPSEVAAIASMIADHSARVASKEMRNFVSTSVISIARPLIAGTFDGQRVREGFARRAPIGLSFDTWMYHTQLGALIDRAMLESNFSADKGA